MNIRYCPECGRSIPLDAKICPYCTKKIPMHDEQIVKEKPDEGIKIALIILAVVIAFFSSHFQ